MIALDTNDDSHIVKNDIQVKLTYAEHELICEMLLNAIEIYNFTCPNGIYDLPMDSEIVQRYTMTTNLHERVTALWADRFNSNC